MMVIFGKGVALISPDSNHGLFNVLKQSPAKV